MDSLNPSLPSGRASKGRSESPSGNHTTSLTVMGGSVWSCLGCLTAVGENIHGGLTAVGENIHGGEHLEPTLDLSLPWGEISGRLPGSLSADGGESSGGILGSLTLPWGRNWEATLDPPTAMGKHTRSLPWNPHCYGGVPQCFLSLTKLPTSSACTA
jgi:hypothetical protein